MIGVQIETKTLWYDPKDTVVHPIGDYSEYKKYQICRRFGVDNIEQLTPGAYYDSKTYRITIVEIND